MSTKHWERTSSISFQVLPASIIYQEYKFLEDEEMTDSSTNSIGNQTHSIAALEIFEKFDVSYFHAATPKEEIQASIVE